MLGDKLFSFLYCSDPSWLPSYVLFTAAVLFVCAMPSTTTTEKPRRSETTGIILYGSHRTMHWKKLQYGVMTEIWHHQLPIFILRKSMGWNHQSIRLKPYVLVPYRYSPSTAKVGWEGICAQWSIYQVWRQDNMKDTAHHSYIFVHSLSHSFLREYLWEREGGMIIIITKNHHHHYVYLIINMYVCWRNKFRASTKKNLTLYYFCILYAIVAFI